MRLVFPRCAAAARWVRSPAGVLRLAQVTVGAVVLNVVSGAAVRLSDSGLGCPDWPNCTRLRLTPPLALHPDIEFANRLVVVALVVAASATFVACWVRIPRRRELIWLAGGLVAGVVAEAVVGAVVVYSKLNPYVVMSHFTVGMLLLADAVVLMLMASCAPGPGKPRVPRLAVAASRVAIVIVGFVVVAGAATTGAGPHAGAKGTARIPVPLEDMVRVHSSIVLCLVGLVIALVWWLHRAGAPDEVLGRARLLFGVLVAQGTIGYVQFFTHLPPLLVGVHELGACALVMAVLYFHHGLSSHGSEVPAGGGQTFVGASVDLAVATPAAAHPDPLAVPVVASGASAIGASRPPNSISEHVSIPAGSIERPRVS